MKINETAIVDTFAEGFTMRFARVVVTAMDEYWLETALREFCGFGTSVIACNAEVGVEKYLTADETDDGRIGASVMAFGFSTEALGQALVDRVGQCLMTCPTTAVFNGLCEAERTVPLGEKLRFFGDGFQKSKLIGDRRYWRIPVMDGEFLVEENLGVAKGVAGGNFLIHTADQTDGLSAARRAVEAIEKFEGVITPFPGGVVRSGSKVGSKYKGLVASTSHEYCPTLRGRVESKVHAEANCVYEIVIDGCDFGTVTEALAAGVRAACGPKTLAISAGNYGGQLGKHHFHLRKIVKDS